jgi:NAD(P)H-dependent flavin oxidoreductase YrpB (nitropropane dioxygenase family)
MFKTRITDLFGIAAPIVQGGMRYVARAELVAAVSNGGGIGFISAHTLPTAQALAAEIARTRNLTDKPFGVNLTILPSLQGANPDDYVASILDCGVKFVETAGANPAKYIERFKAAGIAVMHKCTAVRFALKAQELGADAVSLTAFEAGGHPGEEQVPGMVLIPVAAAKLKIPFIASGGFATGAGLVAALALGADGVNMGSRFALSRESPLPSAVKKLMLDATERDTRIILRSIGESIRVVSNDLVERILKLEKEGCTPREELIDLGGGPRWVRAADAGDPEGGAFAAGLSVALIDDCPSAAELVSRMVEQASEVIANRFGAVADKALAQIPNAGR